MAFTYLHHHQWIAVCLSEIQKKNGKFTDQSSNLSMIN
ncbi:hypothetical protein CAter10_3758 [Collimonas arenae]|nr:hypothetical protein CAter10_3758 [Collimonas arenae]